VDKIVAELFYQQCAGSTTGHMAMIPNNPVLHGMLSAAYPDFACGVHACSKEQFAEFLQQASEALRSHD